MRIASIVARCVAAAALILPSAGCAVHSRNPTEVTVYHGKGNSQAVAYEVGAGGRQLTSQRSLEVDLPEGSRVCLNVLNSHTPFFSYSLRTVVDSTDPTPPDFGNVLTILNVAVAGGAAGGSGATLRSGRSGGDDLYLTIPDRRVGGELKRLAFDTVRGEQIRSAHEIFKSNVNKLAEEISDVRASIVRSVLAEELRPGEVRVVTDGERGLMHAQNAIARESDATGHFNDPQLKETIQGWYAAAVEGSRGRSDNELVKEVIDAINARAQTLLAARDAIKNTYGPAPTTWRECRALPKGTTTLHLAALPRETTGFTGQRDTGNVVQVIATSDYRRNVMEMVPLAFLAFPRNVTGFGIVNDTVVENIKYAEDAVFRVGTMLTTSPFRFGRTSEWAVGPGIGTGVIGGDKPALSDFFLGGLVSWRDWIRMGAGYGFSQAAVRLNNGAQVGRPLPLGDGREGLSDFIERKRVGTWFLTFTLTGLKLDL